MRHLEPATIRRVLFRAPNWLGDAVMSTAALRALRSGISGAEVTVLASPRVAPVFQHNPHADRVVAREAADAHAPLGGVLRLGRELRRPRLDLAVLLPLGIGDALAACVARVPWRVGYNTDVRGLLLTHPFPAARARAELHQAEQYLALLRAIGIPGCGRHAELKVTEAERGHAQRQLSRLGIGPGDFVVGLAPGATQGKQVAKAWRADRWAELAARMVGLENARCLVLGAADERSLGKRIRERAGERCVDLCGRTNLRHALALVDRCDLFLANDSGLMHVADALGVPTVAVFGPSDPRLVAPLGRNSRLVRVSVPCGPCRESVCPKPRPLCMEAVSVDAVYETAKELMQEPAAR